MTAALEWEVERGSETRVSLAGDINETSRLADVLSGVPSGVVIIDLSGVRRISSAGVRNWLDFVRGAGRFGYSLIYDRVPGAIVHQLHLVADFAGGYPVRSVMVPYFCSACDVLVERQVEVATPGFALIDSGIPCESCGGRMELDDAPEYYAALARGSDPAT